MCLFLLFDVCFRKNCSTLPIYYSFLYGEKDVVLHRDLIVTLNDTIMKRFGLFLLKNNIHLMTLVFLGWAVWADCNWQELVLVQKLVMGMYAWLIVHEYEEGYKGKFLALFSRVLGRDISQGTPGASHLAQAAASSLLSERPRPVPRPIPPGPRLPIRPGRKERRPRSCPGRPGHNVPGPWGPEDSHPGPMRLFFSRQRRLWIR